MFAVTIDMDWVPDECIKYTLLYLSKYHIRATLFMTNKVSCNLYDHEIAIHPNFISLNYEKCLKKSLKEFPAAKGIRSHCLFFTERFRPLYKKYDLKYDSNFMMYKQKNIRPYYIAPKVVEIPLYFMDTFYLEMENKKTSFSIKDFRLKETGLKVFVFHPIHIYLNTNSLEMYKKAKKYYHNQKKLIKIRNNQTAGIKDLFISLLELINQKKLQHRTLLEIAQDYKNKINIIDKNNLNL